MKKQIPSIKEPFLFPETSVNRQMADKMSMLTQQSSVTWGSQTSKGDGVVRGGDSLDGTDFGKHMLGVDGFTDRQDVQTMSCYEIILDVAIQSGACSKKVVAGHYAHDKQDIQHWLETGICVSKNELSGLNPKSSADRPKPGDIMLFYDEPHSPNKHVTHFALCVGNPVGPIEVFSHHREGKGPMKITVEELCSFDMQDLDPNRCQFSSPMWPHQPKL